MAPPPHRPRPLPVEDDSSSERGSGTLLGASRASRGTGGNVKLPPFSGKEPWQVWFNRFSDVADRYHWSDSDHLDKLLIQGDAGDLSTLSFPERYDRATDN